MSVPRSTFLSIAATALALSFIVLAVMLGLYATETGEDPLDTGQWRAQKTELAGRPTDQAATSRIRDLDLELRRAFFTRRERIRIGGTLLLVALVVALVAVKRANRRSLPEVDAPATPSPAAASDRRTAAGRWAVSVTGLIFLLGGAWLWLFVPTEIPGPGATPEGGVPGGAEDGPPGVEELARQWPSFRGYDGSGIAPFVDVPLTWDGEQGENIAWQTAIPLPGANSPVVWGDRVFLTGANEKREEVYCLDAKTGAMLWKKALVVVGRREDPPEPMEDTGYAAPTAVTDGRYVYALFASGRVAAFDYDGRQVWLKSFGPFENTYGHSSSLAIFKDRVLLQLDHGYADAPLARLLALDAATGKTVWETPRVVDSSWASPIVCYPEGGPQIVLSATPLAAAYDPTTGLEIWRAAVMYGEVAPTPIYRDGVVYVTQEDVGLFAIRADGRGDVTRTHVLWSTEDGAPDVTSPITDGERVYLLTTGGTLTSIRAATGETVYEEELEAEFYASPSLVGDLLLLTDMDGVTRMVKAGDVYEEVGRNPLGEGVYSSAAFGPGRIYFRGKDHLFAIGGVE
jgi:outer membrane protein assembly factor BamB